MKFEKPIMNISMFEMNDVVTTSGLDIDSANAEAEELVTNAINEGNNAVKVQITF